ncbi:hypothetical protein QM201_16965 [Enterobacter asburiae]|nr:hypothetical protein [Enterobacter asburiae]
MQNINLLANIDNTVKDNIIGRIGGNIPENFNEKLTEIEGLNFYATFQHPEKMDYISIFVPKSYDELLEKNMYPDCGIKVFVHPCADESNNEDYTIDYIKKTNISGYKESGGNDYGFITKASQAKLIQDEDYYYLNLKRDGFVFLLQLDEDFYPEDLLDGDYIFGYGALYLYQSTNDDSVIAGFWQSS